MKGNIELIKHVMNSFKDEFQVKGQLYIGINSTVCIPEYGLFNKDCSYVEKEIVDGIFYYDKITNTVFYYGVCYELDFFSQQGWEIENTLLPLGLLEALIRVAVSGKPETHYLNKVNEICNTNSRLNR